MVGTESEYGTRSNKSAFCRACDDFKTWAKLKKGPTEDSSQDDATKKIQPKRSALALACDSSEDFIYCDVDDKKVASDVVSTASTDHRNCPLDKDDLGRSTWGLLHTIAAYYPDSPSQETKDDTRIFFEKFAKIYPCKSCADHFREQITTYPPKVSNQQTLSRWLCDMHNLVNQRTGKPIFDCSRVNERWRDGWRDGSCD